MTSKWERFAPLTGALAIPFWIAGIAVFSTNAKGSKGPKILASYQHHSNGILLGGFLWSLGVLLFIWFLSTLRTHYAAAEGGTGRLANLAWSGGLVASGVAILIPAGDTVGALNKNDIDASGAAVLHHISDGFFVGAEYLVAVLFLASAVLALRYAALPKWLGWLSLVIGVVLLIGPIGWAAFIFAPIWTLIVSVLLWRRAEQPVEAGAPALSRA